MNRRIEITNRTIVLTALIGSLLIMAMLVFNTVYYSRQTYSATSEAVSAVSSFYLDEMADRRAKIITGQTDNTFEQMEKAIEFIKEENIGSQEELRITIGKLRSLLSLNRFALVDEDNTVYTQYTTYTGGSRHSFLAKEKMADREVSTVSIYGSSRQLCLAAAVHGLTIMDRPVKACFVQIDMKDVTELLSPDDHEKIYFALYSGNGANLSQTELGSVISDRNFLEALKELVPEEVWKEHCDHFAEGKAGNLTFFSKDAEETLSYVPAKDTGWQIAVLIRDSVIQDQIRDISDKTLTTGRNQILFSIASVLVLTVILLLEYRQLSKQRLQKEKENSSAFRTMASTDSMTGVRNKHAYTDMETALNAKIQAGEIQKLGVVVCDVNGLKHVNDTKGHAAGDQLIRDACALICERFTHGSVFRIGGDEFVVVLQGKGFDTMDESVRSLNQTSLENIKADKVVIAVGSAVLKEGDQNLRDVFERADQTMYETKKKLKAAGAKTRDSFENSNGK